jgi:beta-lactamase regulating signal transducer with metallopeptidase domain
MHDALALHSIARIFSERLLGSLAGGILLVLIAWIALRLVAGQSSRTRFAVWFATLLGVAVLPAIGRWDLSGKIAPGNAPLLRLPESWALYIFAGWALIALVSLARIVVGLFQLRRVRRTCTPVDPVVLDPAVRGALTEFQRTQPVTLRTSTHVRVPAAIGFRRPTVVVPDWCLRDLAPQELHAVILHELEHLRRRDDWTNLFQRIVGAVLFFHPAVWFLKSRLALEREMACDDAVIAATANPRAYARCLVSLAEKSYLRRGVALAQAAVTRMQEMTARVSQILAADRPAPSSTWKPALYIVGLVTCFSGAMIAVAPQFVAFQNAAPAALAEASEVSVLPSLRTPVTPALATEAAPFRVIEAGYQQTKSAATRISKAAVLKVRRKPPVRQLAQAAAEPRAITPVVALDTKTPAPAQLLLFVVRAQQTDASGMVWNVSVVRWVIYHPPVSRAIDPAIPAKT